MSFVLTFQHPMMKSPYNKMYRLYDFALLKLDSPVKISPTVKLICLPYRNVPHIGSKLIVSGWGKTTPDDKDTTPKLRYVELTGNSVKDCAKMYAAKEKVFVDPNTILCARLGEKRDPLKETVEVRDWSA